MALIKSTRNTTENAIEKREIIQLPRPYLGMSGIGHPCMRKLWYDFRWASVKVIPIRVKRIFERGDLEEARIIKDLTDINIECYRMEGDEKIPITGAIGEPQQTLLGFEQHAMGHPDGQALGVPEAPKTPHLLEFKTANEKSFKEYIKYQSVEKANPGYYAQAQRYMLALNLTRCLFIVTNKNTEERYYERIRFDKEFAKSLADKERAIILSSEPPPKAFDKSWYLCKWCDHRDVCHYDKEPNTNCRMCQKVDLCPGGRWECSLDDKPLDYEAQLAACPEFTGVS
jgi:hypothetical protein